MKRFLLIMVLAVAPGCALVESKKPPPGTNVPDPDQPVWQRMLFGTRWKWVEGCPPAVPPDNLPASPPR
jgi:hypothetical protein